MTGHFCKHCKQSPVTLEKHQALRNLSPVYITHTHAHAHAHTRTHAHAHTRTHAHTHTQLHNEPWVSTSARRPAWCKMLRKPSNAQFGDRISIYRQHVDFLWFQLLCTAVRLDLKNSAVNLQLLWASCFSKPRRRMQIWFYGQGSLFCRLLAEMRCAGLPLSKQRCCQGNCSLCVSDGRAGECDALTFGCSEHGGGQLALLGLDVAEDEPSWVTIGDDWYYMVRPGHVARMSHGFQHW